MLRRGLALLLLALLGTFAHAQAAVSRRAAEKLAQFEGLMKARVDGGLSDMSEQQVISQRYAEVQAQLAADAQAANTAATDTSTDIRPIVPSNFIHLLQGCRWGGC